MRKLTFTLISLILLLPAVDVAAEDNRQRTYIRMEETEIIGVIEHPEITYIIPKTRIRFNQIPLQRDFSTQATRLRNPLALETEVRVKTLLTGP
jgi:2-keto-3-deoxy-galactonokinase